MIECLIFIVWFAVNLMKTITSGMIWMQKNAIVYCLDAVVIFARALFQRVERKIAGLRILGIIS